MNELIPIPLANGSVTHPNKLRTYFDRVIAAEQSGEEFPVSLSDIWRIGYASRDAAVKALKKGFVQGVDYQFSVQLDGNSQLGRPSNEYILSVSCLEYLAVRANRDVFEVYRACRKVLVKVMQGSLPDFSDPVIGARAWADAEEGRRTALALANAAAAQLESARPKVAFFDAVAAATNCIPMSTAAAVLKLPGIGRNLLFRMLRRDGILKRNNEPFAAQISAGHFQVEPKTYDAGFDGEKGKRLATVTRVTPAGLQYLSKKYQPQP